MGQFVDRKCICGVNQPLIESIDGRISDFIKLSDGRKVTGVYFTKLLSSILDDSIHLGIKRFQACQKESGQIELKLEAQIQIKAEIKEIIERSLRKDFENVLVKVVDKIELENSGKFRWVKSEENMSLNSIA